MLQSHIADCASATEAMVRICLSAVPRDEKTPSGNDSPPLPRIFVGTRLQSAHVRRLRGLLELLLGPGRIFNMLKIFAGPADNCHLSSLPWIIGAKVAEGANDLFKTRAFRASRSGSLEGSDAPCDDVCMPPVPSD